MNTVLRPYSGYQACKLHSLPELGTGGARPSGRSLKSWKRKMWGPNTALVRENLRVVSSLLVICCWAQSPVKVKQSHKRDFLDISNNGSSLERRLWRNSRPVLPVAVRLLVFLAIEGCWFLRETSMELQQIKMPQRSLFLPRLCHSPWINTFYIAVSLWLISRLLKIWLWQIFVCFLLALMEKFLEVFTLAFSLTSPIVSLECPSIWLRSHFLITA